MNHTTRFVVFFSVFVTSLLFTNVRADDLETGDWTNLIDPELSQWEVFIGVPHTSVDVEWHSKSESGIKGTPMGLNNDPLEVFSVKKIDGEDVLAITGEIYGGLTTLK